MDDDVCHAERGLLAEDLQSLKSPNMTSCTSTSVSQSLPRMFRAGRNSRRLLRRTISCKAAPLRRARVTSYAG